MLRFYVASDVRVDNATVQLPIYGGLTAQVDWLGLSVGGHPALSLHSSDEPGHRVNSRKTLVMMIAP